MNLLAFYLGSHDSNLCAFDDGEFKYAKAERISLPAKSIDGPLRFDSGLPFRECCRTNRSPFSKRINRQYRNSHKANKYRD